MPTSLPERRQPEFLPVRPLAAILVALVLFIIWRAFRNGEIIERQDTEPIDEKKEDYDAYHDLEPLPNFDWSTTEPIRIRPFKPKYYLTMGRSLYLITTNMSQCTLTLD